MIWYNDKSAADSVVISTRARYARNLEDYPFDLSDSSVVCAELTDRIYQAMPDGFLATSMENISQTERRALLEQHIISPDFIDSKHGILLSNEEKGIYLMTPEEDHIRLQVIAKGYCPDKVLEQANEVLLSLSAKLKFSFDTRLGYLTRCPTNLGKGLRLSVMVFLPALTLGGDIARLAESLSGLGFNLRGMYGEGSGSKGCLYQISNRSSMGISQDELISSFASVVERIKTAEEHARARFDQDECTDIAGRAYGILAFAGKLSYDEFLKHYASLRLGYALALDLPENCNIALLDSLTIELAPGMITKKYECQNSLQRDSARARELKYKLKGD